jgi:hypothetical protein
MKYGPYIKDGFFAWTLTSNGYKYLTWNMYLQWKKCCGQTPLCIICADKPSYSFLQREGVPCILFDNSIPDFGHQIAPFGSRHFSVLNRLKLRLLTIFSEDETIEKCMYLDGDIAIYKNVAEDMKHRLDKEPLWMPCDDQSFECSNPSACQNVCTGIIGYKRGFDNRIFKITDEAKWSSKPEDQVWVNNAIQEKSTPYSVLPRELYPNGARLTRTHINPELKEKAYCMHYNYRVGDSKKADMKRFGDWHLPY